LNPQSDTEIPETEESQRLLRKEMLDILVEKLPASRAEFHEYVPAYLRIGTATQEAKHLDAVLEIIADFA